MPTFNDIHEIDSFYMGMREPDGYGAFDEQLNDRSEDINECEACAGHGSDESISDCCGATRDEDTMLCYECHDHCGPSTCPDCNGSGIIKS